MSTVKVSPKFQVVIPKAIREKIGLRSGMKCQVLLYGDQIEIVPLRPIQELRGSLKGIGTTFEREPDRL